MLGLLFLQFRNLTEALIVLVSVPFALVGSFWTLFLLGYPLSAPVWVGLLSVVGLAMQTGVVMVVYIDEAYQRRARAGQIRTRDDIVDAHAEGTVQRLRPKIMTITTMAAGLLPLLWAEGAGADIMKRIAAPMLGGLATSAFLTLEVLPVLYTIWRARQLARAQRVAASLPAGALPASSGRAGRQDRGRRRRRSGLAPDVGSLPYKIRKLAGRGRLGRHEGMKQHKGTLWLAVAAALLSPSKARAQGRATARAASGGPPQRQGRRQITRRPQALAPTISPCGRHVVEVAGGAVLIDGRRVRSSDDNVFLVAPPTWRGDGSALAWIERSRGESRLVVVPDLDAAPEPLPWTLARACRPTTGSSGPASDASSSAPPCSRRARSPPGRSREPLEVLVPSPTIFFRSSSTSVTRGTSKTFAHVRGVTHLAHSSHVSSAPPERCETETRVGDLPAVLASAICPKGDDR